MKRHSRKTVQEDAKKTSSRPTVTTSTSQAATYADVTAAAAGSGHQRRFTAKRALEMLQNLPDTDSGSDALETTYDDSDSSIQLSEASLEDDDDNVASQSDAIVSVSDTTRQVKPTQEYQRVDIIQKDDKFTRVTASVLALAINRTVRNIEVVTKQPTQVSASSSSTTGHLGKTVSCQVKSVWKHNRTTTLCDVCTRPVCGKCMANACKQ